MMRKLSILVIALLLLGTASAVRASEEPNVLTGLGVYEACKGRTKPDSSYCRGVLLGFVEGLTVVVKGNAWRWSCTGSDASLQIGYVAWAERNAAVLDQAAAYVLGPFLTADGFCKTVKNQGQEPKDTVGNRTK